MTKKIKKTKLAPLSLKELNKLKGGSSMPIIIVRRDPEDGG